MQCEWLLFLRTPETFSPAAFLGVALAAAVVWAWSRYGHRVDLARFFQVTAVFLPLFSVQLAIYAFHEFTEAGMLPVDNEYWHLASEPYGPEGQFGHWLSYGLVLAPLAYLGWSWLRDRLPILGASGAA